MNPVEHPFYEQAWPEGGYRLFQVGLVVDDLVAACSDLARVFGVGPFHVFPRIETPCWYRGTDTAVDLQVAVAQAGPVQFELIQQFCDRPSVYRELAGDGSRIHQLCTLTSDYQAKKAWYEGLGYPLVSEMFVRGQHVGFIDTFADFGFYTELAEDVPGFAEGLTRVARTCAEWDGTTDPVRILTKDGYRTP
ncbi:MAG TPA: VOC family protein [Acidimicrobiia bacterium]|nr:VOC family protein [Acidimicrobiia bacterium]